jgi:hypothetical protein
VFADKGNCNLVDCLCLLSGSFRLWIAIVRKFLVFKNIQLQMENIVARSWEETGEK